METRPGDVVSAFGQAQPRYSGGSSAELASDARAVVLSRAKARCEGQRVEDYSLAEYLDLCRNDRGAYATAAERLLMAIGEPELLDTRKDPRLSRIFSNKVIKTYPAFNDFYGMEDTIEQMVSFFKHAAQALEERKQIYKDVMNHLGELWGFTVRLETMNEDASIESTHECRVEKRRGMRQPDAAAWALADAFR